MEQTPDIGGSGNTPVPTTTNTDIKSTLFAKYRKPKRLASDVIGILQDSLQKDPLNLSIWMQLIQKIEEKDKADQVRSTYENFLNKFPFLSTIWVNYIKYELNRDEFDKAELIFKNCLPKTTGIDLYKTYVNYVRRKNNLITGGEEARGIIIKAYDAALAQVGNDPNSGDFWLEYLQFIENWNPISNFDEQEKMDLKRKIYKKVLKIPINNHEMLWNQYTTFENDLNPTTARKFIGDLSGDYMKARAWYTEWCKKTSNLDYDLQKLPINNNKNNDESTILQQNFNNWMQWIKLERENSLELPQEIVNIRIDYVFKIAIQKLSFIPELWFEIISFYESTDGFKSKLEFILNQSLLVNPLSFALNFKLVEYYELIANEDDTMVKKTYESLISKLCEIHEYKQYLIEELKLELIKKLEVDNNNNNNDDEDEDEVNGQKKINDEVKESLFKSNPYIQQLKSQQNELSKQITLVYCQFMQSIKRIKSTKDTRIIFKEARISKRQFLTHHIFVTNGYLEYYNKTNNNNLKIALNVFAMGLKPNFFKFDGEYIFKYLKFLIKINDDVNIRTEFENAINNKDKIELKWIDKMFKLFINYEIEFGQLKNVLELEKRYLEIFSKESKILLFADRYCDMDQNVDLIRKYDLIKMGKTKRKYDEMNDLKEIKIEEDDEDEDEDDYDITENGNKKLKIEEENEDSDEDEDKEEDKQFVSDEIYNLLRILPNASHFTTPLFNNSKLIKLLSDI